MLDGTGVIENRKGGFVGYKETGATPDDLFEFHDGANPTGQDDIFAGGTSTPVLSR